MEIKNLKKYLKIYFKFFRFGVLIGASYRTSFFLEVLIELGYQLALIMFFQVIYGNISSVAGWSYYEIMFLTGVTIVISEVMIGSVFIFNLYRLPKKIIKGDVDADLLKPLNSQFYLSLNLPYFASFISCFTGIYLVVISLINLHIQINFLNLTISLLILICGIVIYYSLSVILTSLVFKFLNADSLPRVAQAALDYFMERPHQIYFGVFKLIFYFLFPIIYITSVPSYVFLKGFELNYLVGAMFSAFIFLFLSNVVWKKMIRLYSSASS